MGLAEASNRGGAARPLLASVLLMVALLACAPQPASEALAAEAGVRSPGPAMRVVDPETAAAFSTERAWDHLDSISSTGPRAPDSRDAAAVRKYIRNRLAASALEVEEVEFQLQLARASTGEAPAPRRMTSLIGLLSSGQGGNQDLLLVAAPYTSPERDGEAIDGIDQGGSGAAVALELARALAEGDRHYGYLFVFIAGDGLETDPIAGSRAVVGALRSRGLLERVRAGMFLDRVGHADLRIARDLQSSTPLRDIVWQTARKRGRDDAFATEGFDSPNAGHIALRAAGLRQLVALIDAGRASNDPDDSGDSADGAAVRLDDCSQESLEIVGTVTLDSLREIEDRFWRLDNYAAGPADATRANARDREAAAIDAHPERVPPASEDSPEAR